MVDDKTRVRVTINQRRPASRFPEKIKLIGKLCFTAARQMRSRPGSTGTGFVSFVMKDADADRPRRFLPVGDDVGHRRIVRVDRLDECEPAGMGLLHFHGVAGRRSGTS